MKKKRSSKWEVQKHHKTMCQTCPYYHIEKKTIKPMSRFF